MHTCQQSERLQGLHPLIVVGARDSVQEASYGLLGVDGSVAENLGRNIADRVTRVFQELLERVHLERIFRVLGDVSRLGLGWGEDAVIADDNKRRHYGTDDAKGRQPNAKQYDPLIPGK